jgi:small-conductance mechanosensitive channel
MSKSSIAVALCLLLLCAGCGGSSHSTADRKAACAKARAARAQYDATFTSVGPSLNKTEAGRAIAATSELKAAAKQLQSATGDSEKRQLDQLVAALSQQEKVVSALASRDLTAASKYAAGLNQTLSTSLASLKRICAKS